MAHLARSGCECLSSLHLAPCGRGLRLPGSASIHDCIVGGNDRKRVVLEGEGPRILASDFNLEVQHSPLAAEWRRHGFVEVQELHAMVGGGDPLPTCKGRSRKDFLYVSPEVQGWFVRAEVAVGPFADHSLLMRQLGYVHEYGLEPRAHPCGDGQVYGSMGSQT